MGDGDIDFLDSWRGAKFRIPNKKMEQATKYPNLVDFENTVAKSRLSYSQEWDPTSSLYD